MTYADLYDVFPVDTGRGWEVKNSPSRLDAGRKLFEESGVKILHFYMTTGRYDMVTISEAPNDEAMAKATLTLVGREG